MIARNGGRHCKEQRDRRANEGRPQRRKGDLSEKEGDAARDCADDDRSDRTRTGVIGGKSRCDAGEERKCINCNGEQQQQRYASPTNTRMMPMMIMVMVLRTKSTAAPSTTTTARYPQ